MKKFLSLVLALVMTMGVYLSKRKRERKAEI